MNEEVNNLLKRLGELEDAPLIWVNKKVYDMAEEIERLNKECNTYMKIATNKQKRIDKAIEYIKEKARNNCWIDQYEASSLINILQGEDKE